MKTILLAFILLASFVSAYSQKTVGGDKEKKDPAQRAANTQKRLTKQLVLTDDQGSKVYEAALKRINAVEAIRAELPGEANKEARKTKISEVITQYEADMKGILTEQQFIKWQEMRQKNKENREKKKGKTIGESYGDED